MLDSGLTIDLFSGMVGVPRPMFLSQPFEQFSVGSPETIRGSDIFLAQLGPQGTIVSFFRRNSQSGWSAEFSTLVPYQVFRAFALFDYDRDGDLEFLAAIEGAAALTVYEQGQSGLEYSGKVKLPFVPGALVSTEDVSTLGESYLHVFDRELRNSVTFSSLYSGVYSFSKPTTFKKKTIVQLDPPSDAAVGAVYAVLEYVDRVVILEQVAGFRQIASFPSWPGVPTVVVGDIQGTGSPQVLLVP